MPETTGQRIVREWNTALSSISLAERIDAAIAEATKSLTAQLDECCNAVRNQRGDDLCWIENAKAAKALPEAEFLESCRRYRNQIVDERGEFTGGRTIAQLEAALAEANARADHHYNETMKAHRWFSRVFGEQMNGRDFDVKLPMADAAIAEAQREPCYCCRERGPEGCQDGCICDVAYTKRAAIDAARAKAEVPHD